MSNFIAGIITKINLCSLFSAAAVLISAKTVGTGEGTLLNVIICLNHSFWQALPNFDGSYLEYTISYQQTVKSADSVWSSTFIRTQHAKDTHLP